MDTRDEVLKFPGGEFLEAALSGAHKRLGNERIDNLYRASLIGGNVGARLMLANDERCVQKWGKGDSTKAARILVVWASTAMLRLLQHEEDQDSVKDGTTRGFSLLFHSDKGELQAELLAYQQVMKAAHSGPSNEILYLRTLRALGDEGVPSFKLLPVPWGKLRKMSEVNPRLSDILDFSILLPVNPWLLVPEALVSTLQTAHDYLVRMGAQR